MLGLGNGLGFNRVIGVPFLLDKFSGAAAAYSLRALSSTTTDVVRVRRSSDNAEQDFSSGEITDGTLEDFVNARDVAPADYGTGAAAAYSLRYVSDSYTGDVVRVRRDSDNAEADFNPTEITDGTLLTWVGNTASDNGHVTTWYDQSGNSNDATQATAASQPKIVDAGVLVEENGKPAVDFDAVNNINLFANTSAFSQPNTIFALGTVDSITGNAQAIIDGITSRNLIGISSTGKYQIFSGTAQVSSNNATANQNLYSALFDGVSSSLYVNEVQEISGDAGTEALDDIRIGHDTNLGSTGYWTGNIQEILVYNSDQSSNRENIEANVNDYYSIYTNTNDGFVTTWYDQAGSNDATQATAAAQPQIVSGGSLITENGKAAMQFNSFKYLVSSSFSALSTYTFFDVLFADNSTQFIRDGINTANRSALYVITTTRYSRGLASTSTYTNNVQSVYTTVASGSSTELAQNGSSFESLSAGSDTLTGINIGGTFDNSVFPFLGKYQEIILYSSDQSGNRTAIETNINNHYSIY